MCLFGGACPRIGKQKLLDGPICDRRMGDMRIAARQTGNLLLRTFLTLAIAPCFLTAQGQLGPSDLRSSGSPAYMQAQVDAGDIDRELSAGHWRSAEAKLLSARQSAMAEYHQGARDVGEELCIFDYQLGMINQLIYGRFRVAERMYKEALTIAAGVKGNDSVWWQADDLRAIILRWLAAVYMKEGELEASISALSEFSELDEHRLAQQMVRFPTVERDDEVGIGGAVLGGQVGSLVGTNLAASLAASLGFTNRQANQLSFQTVLRTKGRQSDLIESGTAFFRKQSPEQFSLYSEFLSVKTAFAIDSWIDKSDPGRLKNEVDRLKREAERTKGAVASLMLSARQAAPHPPPTAGATPSRVAAKVPPGSVLLEYFVFRPYDPAATGKNGRYIWRSPRYAVYVTDSADELHVLDLGDANEIDALVDQFRTIVGQPGSMNALERVAGKLAEKVWTPVTPYLKGRNDVFIAPDGRLNLVPFGALVNRNHMFLIVDLCTGTEHRPPA
jgi:hypothetical protein